MSTEWPIWDDRSCDICGGAEPYLMSLKTFDPHRFQARVADNEHSQEIENSITHLRDHGISIFETSKHFRILSDIARGSMEHLSNIYRASIEQLSHAYRTSVGHQSNIYRNSMEYVSDTYRTPIENLSNNYWAVRLRLTPKCQQAHNVTNLNQNAQI